MRTGQKKLKVVTGESAEMKELRQDVPRVGNELHRPKQQRKSKKKRETDHGRTWNENEW